MDKTAFKGSLNLNFFEKPEFESLEGAAPDQKELVFARNALRLLMMGWPKHWTDLISWPVFKAIFIQRDPNLVRALRLAFQQGFENLFKQLSVLELSEEQKEQAQLYLSNCLSLLPYSDLTPYESIKIPQLIASRWELVDYYVTPIELTSRKGFKRYFIKDQDRVFAYGLQPINDQRAQSHLIFMGTTYPAGQGFVSQIDADFKAFDSVGNTLYQSGRKKILAWLLQQHSKVHVCGVSLGGSLSLLFALDQGDHIERVDALNPPGLIDAKDKHKFDQWDDLVIKPQVVIQQQANDPVSTLGVWKKEWDIVQVTPPAGKQGPNRFCDHFLNYAGFSGTQFTYVSAEEENIKRRYRNFFIFSLGRSLVYYMAIWPFSFLFRPSLFFVYEHLLERSVALSVGAAIGIFIVGSALGLTPLYIVSAALIGGLLSYCFIMPWLMKQELKKENALQEDTNAHLHDPILPRNQELNIYNPNNAIDLELTQGEINTYYSVMRCLVKQKKFIPTDDKPYKYQVNLSKKELLLARENPDHHDKKVHLHMPKAKVIHIKRTLALTQQIGLANKAELKEAVEQEYAQYCLGKGKREDSVISS